MENQENTQNQEEKEIQGATTQLTDEQFSALAREKGFLNNQEVNNIVKKNIEKEAEKVRKEEAEKAELAKLSETEKFQKIAEDNEQKAKEYQSELEYYKQRTQTNDILKEKSLDTDFVDFLIIKGDNEKTLENINIFKKKFDEALKKAVEEKIPSTVPKGGGKTETDPYLMGFENGFK